MTPTVKADAKQLSANEFSVADDTIATLQIQLSDNQFRLFYVHESLLCKASPVFEAALQGQFGEATSRAITIKETHFETLDDFVYWIYRGKCANHKARSSAFTRYARLNSFAEKYEIVALKYELAIAMGQQVKSSYRSFWPGTAHLVDEIYSNTRPGDYFRTLIVAIYVYRIKPQHFMTVNSAQYLEKYPDFAVEVASAMGRRLAGPHTIKFDASMFIKPGSRSDSRRKTRPSSDSETQSGAKRVTK